jgi:protein-tyrosine phosphatase
MKKIMFVCLGNICRSPVAEAVMAHLIAEKGLQKKFRVDSSGTSAFHVGADPDPRMAAAAEKKGIAMDHSAQQFIKDHFGKNDLIFAMDKSNYDGVTSLTQNSKFRDKVHLFRDFDLHEIGSDVPDPYYRGGMAAFDEVFEIVERTCQEILTKLLAKKL